MRQRQLQELRVNGELRTGSDGLPLGRQLAGQRRVRWQQWHRWRRGRRDVQRGLRAVELCLVHAGYSHLERRKELDLRERQLQAVLRLLELRARSDGLPLGHRVDRQRHL